MADPSSTPSGIYVGPPFPTGPQFPKPSPLPPVPLPPMVVPPPQFDPAGPTAHIYWSVQGDWWDLIALKVYGMKRGDDHLMHILIEANYHIRDIARFPGGYPVVIPALATKTTIPLVPWKSASIVS